MGEYIDVKCEKCGEGIWSEYREELAKPMTIRGGWCEECVEKAEADTYDQGHEDGYATGYQEGSASRGEE